MSKLSQIELFKQVILIRRVEEFIANIYHEEKIRCPVHLAIGHEAVSVGVCKALDTSDAIFSNHRSHAHYLAKGGDLYPFFCELMGKSDGCSKGQGGSMHLCSIENNFLGATSIVSGTLPVAAGHAWANKLRKKSAVTLSFIGDGALEEGVFWETINYAAAYNLPFIICVENNNYACYSSIETRRKQIDLSKLAQACNVNYQHVSEGENVDVIYNTMTEIKNSVLENKMSHIVEFDIYRRYEHCGPNIDDHLNYRNSTEMEKWKTMDPLSYIDSVCSEDQKKQLDTYDQEIQQFITKEYKRADESENAKRL